MAKREMVLDMDDLSSISIECGHCTSRLSLALESWKGNIFSLGCPGCGESFFRDLPGHEPKLREVLRSLSRTFGQMCELAPHRLLFHVQEPPAPAKSKQSTVVYRPQDHDPMHRA
jgi:hypothetical protein